MNFNKNDLMDAVNKRFFESFCCTLDVGDYVPAHFLEKVDKYIFKQMRKAWKHIEHEDRKYQRKLKRKKCQNTQKDDEQNEEPSTE